MAATLGRVVGLGTTDLLARRNKYLRELPLQAQTNGAVTRYNPVQQLQQFQQQRTAQQEQERLRSSGSSYDAALAEYKVKQQAKPKDDGGGLSGALGTVLGGLGNVGEAAMTGLKVIDVPRRSVVRGVEQAKRNLNPAGLGRRGLGEDENADWLTADDYGFGSVIGDVSDSKWLNRTLGFTGDVALDPLTYVTLGAGRFAGQAGREAAAIAARQGGLESADTLAKIGRLGVNALGPEERAAFNAALRNVGSKDIGEAGLRFAGQRLPGTGGLADAVGGGLARARAAIGDTALGRGVRSRRGAEATRQAREALHHGGLPNLSARGAGEVLDFHSAERAVGGELRNVYGRALGDEVAGLSARQRVALTHAAERGELGDHVVQRVAQAARQRGVNIPESAGYMPHVLTPAGRAFFDNAPEGGRAFINDAAASGFLRKRELLPGTHTLYGRTFTLEDGTIEELNRVLPTVFADKLLTKPYEDDYAKLGSLYINGLASDAGTAAGIQRVGVPLSEAMEAVPDDAAMRSAVELLAGQDRAARNAAVAQRRDVVREAGDLVAHAQTAGVAAMPSLMQAAADVPETVVSLRRLTRKFHKQAPRTASEIRERITELDAVLLAAGQDEALQPTAYLLAAAAQKMAEADHGQQVVNALRQVVRDGRTQSEVDLIFKHELRDGWRQIGDQFGLDYAVRAEVEQALRRVETEVNNGGLWRLLDSYTQFFKTYATLSPGFHVRNAMGATFMNLTEGVKVREMTEALALWKRYTANPEQFMATADDRVRTALQATFGSGAGGSVSAEELVGGSDVLGRLTSNRVSKLGRTAGEWVEGPARLSLALNSVDSGMSLDEAIARLTRVHFDYSELSNFDRHMKRIIPFWTFMSRNLPLQLQQILTKPRVYQQYASLVRNMREDDDGAFVPLWWRERGAFRLPFGDDLYAMPDLQHVNLGEDLAKLDPSNPLRLFSDVNPLLRVPAELAFDRKAFTDSPIREDENRWLYALLNMVPTAAQGARLSGTGQYDDKQLQNLLNYLGVPVRQLTPAVESGERRRREWADQ
ncbi:MAG TPA: hypothetical protein VNQ73_03400 [Ilumatobacter sp.]|nr:hypothetical protein [Ilumatobacter sp.]